MKVAAIILAAGESRRMGQPKQLLSFGDETLVRRTARTALASVCDIVFVVLGAGSDQIRKELEDLPLQLLDNPNWPQGMGASIHRGIRSALETQPDLDAVILLLADQPRVTPDTINRLVAIGTETSKPVVASAYADTVGVPAWFSSDTFDDLKNLPADRGAKQLIVSRGEGVALMPAPEAECDIDTPQDYQKTQ